MTQPQSIPNGEGQRRSAAYAVLAVAVIQLVATVVLSIMFAVDMIGLGACAGCPDDASDVARLLFFIPTLTMIALTVGATIASFIANRSLSWVPLIATVGTVVAYVVTRSYIYSAI